MEPNNSPTPAAVAAERVRDSLRWVAQNARGLIMAGHTDPRHDAGLRTALKSLDEAYSKMHECDPHEVAAAFSEAT